MIEAFSNESALAYAEASGVESFPDLMNQAFEEFNIGWRMRGSVIAAMGDNMSRPLVEEAITALGQHALPTAQGELQEAVRDLSRRPDPDCTGAVQHAMAALEAVLRRSAQDDVPTLGALLIRYPDLVAEPLKTGLAKLWGWACELGGRHGREGNQVDRTEAHAVVSIAAAVVPFLLARLPEGQDSGNAIAAS